MIPVKEEGEKSVLSEQDREMEEEQEEGSVEDGASSEEDDDGDESDDSGDKKAEDSPQTLETPVPAQPEEEKRPGGLNVNNEVVKMRKEVKRVRALIIRKLTRQIGKLKKKKGKEADVERNQRRAGRLLEEIHAMKVLPPDQVGSTEADHTGAL